MDSVRLREIVDFSVKAARAAGDLTLQHFGPDTPYDTKADNTPVTAADRGAEALLRERIEKAFPTHAILGEEFGEKEGSEPARWVLDPIDGTYSFISGVPLYAVLVGFEWRGDAVAGVIHLPALNETLWAARELGCWWNGRRAHVSDVRDLAQARLLYGGAKGLHACGRTPAFERLRDACRFDRAWCDAYAYALLATGRAEIVLDPIVNIWDTAAVMPVVTEAGGTFTNWSGNVTHTAGDVIATNGHLHQAVLAAARS